MSNYPIGIDDERKALVSLKYALKDRPEAGGVYMALEKLEGMTPMDVSPVVHGRWGYRAYRTDAHITVSGEVVCSNCHAAYFRVRDHWFKFCPHCGAKMDAKDIDVPTKDGGAADV